MSKKSHLIFILQFCLLASAHGAFPPSYTATYDVEKSNLLVGQSTVTLNNENENIHFSQEIILAGFAAWFGDDQVTEDSWLTKIGDQHILSKYQYIYNNEDNDENGDNGDDEENNLVSVESNRDVFFETQWKQNKDGTYSSVITGTTSGKPFTLDTAKLTWDTLSFQLALMNEITEKRKKYNYQILSKGKLKQYNFTLLDRGNIKINGENYNTVRLDRIQTNKVTKIWLASDFHYIPILIEKYKDNKIDTRATLTSLKINDEQK